MSLVSKIRAIFTRKDLQPRDFYDVVWFLSKGVMPDRKLFPEMKVEDEREVLLRLTQIYEQKVKPALKNFKRRLAPFLLREKNIYYLDIFGEVIKKKFSKQS
ncbi:MAG: nucleotidyl transferase AbiEii/AbiGii toxin family protein [Candidatus Portnoybacteria bacterium]|nr:nucleotidyl transferase AbiEii/AbiGii toxin family protein [Candidatus Portnoybacteria bacterium]